MEPIRVVLIDLPRMLCDVVRGLLAGAAEAQVVAEVRLPGSLIAAVDEAAADLVIAGHPSASEASVLKLLEARPRVKAVAIADDGRRGVLYELRPHRVPLGEMSPRTLLAAIGLAREPRPDRAATPEAT